MATTSEKIFTVYEKPEAPEPTDRVVLLRDGFSWGAFLFTGFWLIWHRQWLLFVGYGVAATVLMVVAEMLHLSSPLAMLAQLWLQLMLAYQVSDAQGWVLERRGYRFAGILTAESQMQAQRRYYEFAA